MKLIDWLIRWLLELGEGNNIRWYGGGRLQISLEWLCVDIYELMLNSCNFYNRNYNDVGFF